VVTIGFFICCNKCQEPHTEARRSERKNSSGIVPDNKRRTYMSSTRCGCPFKITHSLFQKKDPQNRSIKITYSSLYKHGNGCFPCRPQLMMANGRQVFKLGL
jgi:hypothetical protein